MPEAVTGQIHPGLSREEYDALPGWNSSLLKIASARTPAHAHAAYRDPDAPTTTDSSALLVGSALHCLLLEPQEFEGRYLVPPEDAPRKPTAAQRSAAKPSAATLEAIAWWDDFEQQAATRQLLSAADWTMAHRLHQSIAEHPALGPYFAADGPNALNELTLTWNDHVTGADCKARLDAVRLWPDHIRILDLKSAADAAPGEFGRAAVKYGYLQQGAFYRDGLLACRRSLAEFLELPASALDQYPIAFEFVVPEKAYPWLVGRYFLTDAQLEAGRERYRRALQAVIAADATGYWPGYDHAALPLELPPWFQ